VELPPSSGIGFDRSDLAVIAAMNHVGVAMGRKRLVQKRLESGELIAPFGDMTLKCHQHYYVTTLPGRQWPKIDAFIEWLHSLYTKAATGEVARIRRQPLSGSAKRRLYRLLMVGKARGQRQPAQQNQQTHQHHQQTEAALTGLRHHRRQPGQHAGADILQAAHQRPGGTGEERECSIAPLVASGNSMPAPKKNSAAGTSRVQTVMTPSSPGIHIIRPPAGSR
jgi:hypothetical protein